MSPRILMLSLSRDLAEGHAAAANEAQVRQRLYAGFCDSVDILVKSPETAPAEGTALASNLRVHPTGTRSNVATAWRMWTEGNRILRRGGCNLVVAQEPFLTGVVGAALATRWRLPLCLHYVCDFLDNEHWLRERPLHRLLNIVGKLVARRAAAVRVDSRDQRERLAAVGVAPERVHYVPFLQPGLERFAGAQPDPAVRRDLLDGGHAVVLTVARLDPQKDLDTLLDVAARVCRVSPGVRFVVAGDGPERARFEDAVRHRGLDGCVRLLGWVPFEQLPALFASADLFLLTSRYETSARVLVLARAAGLPIVTTAVSGAAELAHEGAGSATAAVGDAAAIAALLERKLARQREARLLAASAHEAVLHDYSEAVVVRAMEALCAAALDSDARQKLVYVLPRYDAATEEHFLHTYGLLEALARRADLAVIVERAVGRPAFGSARVHAQRWADVPPLRVLEILWLVARLRARGYRTFYVHYSYFGAAAAWAVTRLAGGRVFYWHCVSEFFRRRGWSREAIAHRLRAELPLALTMRIVDYVVTGTPSLAAAYQRTFGMDRARVRIVPNDIHPERFAQAAAQRAERRAALGIGPHEFVVLFVHRLAPRKGAQHLPAIARRVRARVGHSRFVVAGDGPSRGVLQAEIAADPVLPACVTLLGWVANADIAGWYAAADAFVMPSEEEGFPRVLLECMAAGLPFVAADVGGVRDICDAVQQWSIVPAGDVTAFADHLVALEREPGRRRALIAAGLARVRDYTTEVVADRTLQQLDLAPRPPVAHPPVAAGASAESR